MPKQDTKLESQGAEFLVLGHMLIEGISCYKAYVNFPGYDLIAANAETGKVARIQVKSRWATDYDKSFPVKNFDCDFVVHVGLNRGYRFSKKKLSNDIGIKAPDLYVFPTNEVRKVQSNDSWGKVKITKIKGYESYKENWGLIKKFLS